eukprot:UN19218
MSIKTCSKWTLKFYIITCISTRQKSAKICCHAILWDFDSNFLTDRNNVIFSFEIRPERGMVGFGSGLHNWGFTLRDFAGSYHKRFGLTKKKMMKRLWGNWCYHPIMENGSNTTRRGPLSEA